MNTTFAFETKSLQITRSDHFVLEAPMSSKSCVKDHRVEFLKLYRSRRKIKGNGTVNVLFLLDRMFKSINKTQPIEKQWTYFIKNIMFCVGRFTPEQTLEKKKISVMDSEKLIKWIVGA